ncbi:hypothetical protein [Streptomyces sp. NBC_00859]|nr:hypothetical protein OG584_19635 [Streptomyces sp. NBC_00859]
MTTATATAAPRPAAGSSANAVRSTLRALSAFASAAFSVMILGEHGRR